MWHFFSSVVLGLGRRGDKSFVRLALERAEGSHRRRCRRCCWRRLHVLVHGAISGEHRLGRRQLQVEVVDGERDDDDEGQDEAQDEGEGLLQALPLVGDALVGCENKTNTVSVVR